MGPGSNVPATEKKVRQQTNAISGEGSLINNSKFRAIVFQILTVFVLVFAVYFVVSNTIDNLTRLGTATGFGFLDEVSGFDISFTLIDYDLQIDSYRSVFLVGALNTILIAVTGIIFATIIGFVMGVLRLSNNIVVKSLATLYVEILRNVPLLLQLLTWYAVILSVLPGKRQSIDIFGAIFVNNRGIMLPVPVSEPGFMAIPITFVLAIIATFFMSKWAKRRQDKTGKTFPTFMAGLGLIIGAPIIVTYILGVPYQWEYPVLKGFNFVNGTSIPPEFTALFLGLSLYTGAFIAEIVRSGILAVSHGQTEAASSLGLKPNWTMRLIIIPQALRVIIPPLTSQYLNLTKNSSLAVAIGYAEIVSVFMGTSLNQTGQAIEIIAITMAFYLTLSLLTSIFMNFYNRRIALKER